MKKTTVLWVLMGLLAVLPVYGQKYTRSRDFTIEGIFYYGKTSGYANAVRITGYTGGSKDVNIPPWIRGLAVVEIGGGAFRDKELTSVIIPDSVEIIGGYAFERNRLSSVTIPDSVNIIGEGAFYGNQLTSVTIPNNVTEIRRRAFYGNQLTSVTLPEGVALGDEVFAGNNQLVNVPISRREQEQAQERVAQEARKIQWEQERQAEQERLANLYRQARNNYGNFRNTSRRYGTTFGNDYLITTYDFGDGNYIRQSRTVTGFNLSTTNGTYRVNGDTVIFFSSEGEYSSGTIVGTALNIGGDMYR